MILDEIYDIKRSTEYRNRGDRCQVVFVPIDRSAEVEKEVSNHAIHLNSITGNLMVFGMVIIYSTGENISCL